jgi:predicted TIM-barrel fold metal-dependent hydrolase
MDASGVRVAVLYPNIAGLASDPFVDYPDLKTSVAHLSAYNDFLLEWIAPARDRFVPLAVIPYWDVPSAVAEIERAVAAGHRGIVTTGAPHQHNQPYLGDRQWDPIWAACQAAGVPVSFHAANGDISAHIAPQRIAVDGPEITYARASTASFLDNGQQVTDLILCGVLARFPELKFISVESGLGWIPFVLESADYHFKKYDVSATRPEFTGLLPSELFRRQVYVNYWFERLQPWHLDVIGVDNILFETDFPHPTCLYGDEVDRALNNGLEAQPPDVQEKILWRNAAKLFGIER